jgi:inner membrane transporter RhtA
VPRVPAPLLVLGSILSVQIGAAIAKGGFGLIPPTAFVWLRLLTSAVILLVIARPRFRGRSRADIAVMIGFGGCLALMNWSIYQSMARIPLGVAVTFEFLGPLTVAILTSRRLRDLAWVLLAGIGVALLGFTPHGLTLVGVGFALLAGTGWAGYILFSAETGRRWPGISGLALASSIGAITLAVPAVVDAGIRLATPKTWVFGVAVGLLSSVIPYTLELNALRRIPPGVFGILMSLEPAVAALAAAVLLGEILRPTQWLAIGCVVAASVGATWANSRAGARVASPGGG